MSFVDVIIVTYGSADLVPGCLGSLAQSDQISRTVVVDNGADGSAEAARRAGADVVIENECNFGFARAVNRGLRELEREPEAAQFVLLLNPDARLGQDTLSVLTSAFASDPSVAIAGPLLRNADGALTAGAGPVGSLPTRIGHCLPLLGRMRCLQPEYRLPGDACALGSTVDVGYLYGAAMLVERRFLIDCGGLDARYFLFAEDEDLCRQAWAAGRRVVLAGGAEAMHAGGASYRHPPLIEAQRLFSAWRLFQKWDGDSAAAVYRRGILAAFAARAVAAGTSGRARDSIQCTARLFGRAVQTGVDPLIAAGLGGTPRELSPRAPRS